MIDLAYARRAILLRLLSILESQAVKHEHVRVVREVAMQVVRHLLFGCDARVQVGGSWGSSALRVGLYDHHERRMQWDRIYRHRILDARLLTSMCSPGTSEQRWHEINAPPTKPCRPSIYGPATRRFTAGAA